MQKFLLLLLALLTLAPAATAQDDTPHPREIARIGRSIPDPRSLQWRPDGQVPARREGNKIQFYDISYVKLNFIPVPDEYLDGGSRLVWSPNGQYIAILHAKRGTEQERLVQVWFVEPVVNFAQLVFEQPSGKAFELSWRPLNNQLAFGGNVYDIFTGKVVFAHQYGDVIRDRPGDPPTFPEQRDRYGWYNNNWSSDGNRFVAVSYAYPATSAHQYGIFTADTDTLLVELQESRTDPLDPDFIWNFDDTKVTDGTRVWDTHTGDLLTQLVDDDVAPPYGGFSRGDYYVVWSNDADTVITLFWSHPLIGYPNSFLIMWDATTGEILYKRTFWHNLKDLRWDNGILKARTFEGYNLTIDPDSGEVTAVEDTVSVIPSGSLVWSPDTTQLVSISGGMPSIPMQMWNVASILEGNVAEPLWTVNDDWFLYETEAGKYTPTGVKALWSSQGDSFITISQNYWIGRNFHSIEQWDSITGQSKGRLYWAEGDWHQAPIAEPSPDFKRYALSYSMSERENQVDVIGAVTQETIVTLQGEKLTAALWSPDGSMLVTYDIRGESPVSQIWDMANEPGRLIHTFENGGDRAAWSPDGRFIAFVSERLLVADPLTGEVYIDFPVKDGPEQPIWSPDSRYVAVASWGEVSFFDTTIGNLKEMARLDSIISAIAWSPDGRMLALGMSDGTIRIWDVADLME